MTSAIQQLIASRERDLGEMVVRRILPSYIQQAVGPFIFFDHMGPLEFNIGSGPNVRPHPHIGLATITYLFEGSIMHRDNTGAVQLIAPGDVNWMTAGRGIVHSERTPSELIGKIWRLHGIQTWLALPKAHEETPPQFFHHPAHTLPHIQDTGLDIRIIAGHLQGIHSPVEVFSNTLYADVKLAMHQQFTLRLEHEERAVYVIEGGLDIDGELITPCNLAVLKPEKMITMIAHTSTRFLLLGGDKLDGHRHMWWNFVASDREKIEAAKTK